MKCDYLSGEYVLSCTADRGVYIPSLFELEEYCRTTKSTLCPLHHPVAPKEAAAMDHRKLHCRWPSTR